MSIRAAVLSRDGGKCVMCNLPASNVHHNSYAIEVLIGKDASQLFSLCRSHHERAEFNEDGSKRSLEEVRASLSASGLKSDPVDVWKMRRQPDPNKCPRWFSAEKNRRQYLASALKREQENGTYIDKLVVARRALERCDKILVGGGYTVPKHHAAIEFPYTCPASPGYTYEDLCRIRRILTHRLASALLSA